MPTSTTYQIQPVFDMISADPSVSGAGGANDIADDSGGDGGGNAIVTFSKALVDTGQRGGPKVTYPVSVTLIGSVVVKGTPVLLSQGGDYEPRQLAQIQFEISTDVDPGVELGEPLETDDLVVWAGRTLFVMGTSYPVGSGYVTRARMTT